MSFRPLLYTEQEGKPATMLLVWQTSSRADAPDTYPFRFKLTSNTQKTLPDFLTAALWTTRLLLHKSIGTEPRPIGHLRFGLNDAGQYVGSIIMPIRPKQPPECD